MKSISAASTRPVTFTRRTCCSVRGPPATGGSPLDLPSDDPWASGTPRPCPWGAPWALTTYPASQLLLKPTRRPLDSFKPKTCSLALKVTSVRRGPRCCAGAGFGGAPEEDGPPSSLEGAPKGGPLHPKAYTRMVLAIPAKRKLPHSDTAAALALPVLLRLWRYTAASSVGPPREQRGPEGGPQSLLGIACRSAGAPTGCRDDCF